MIWKGAFVRVRCAHGRSSMVEEWCPMPEPEPEPVLGPEPETGNRMEWNGTKRNGGLLEVGCAHGWRLKAEERWQGQGQGQSRRHGMEWRGMERNGELWRAHRAHGWWSKIEGLCMGRVTKTLLGRYCLREPKRYPWQLDFPRPSKPS
jgi:hypothetical protein